jgi:predicted nucleic acid-binding Zn ribbon protein
MKKWEYKEVRLDHTKEDTCLFVCNREGQDGWELCYFYTASVLFFKREIPDLSIKDSVQTKPLAEPKTKCCFCGQNIEDDIKNHFLICHEIMARSIKSAKRLGYEFGDSLGGWSLCRCKCHFTEDVEHCAPCCYSCPVCGQNIEGLLDNHIFDQHPEKWKHLKDVLEKISE